jgi:hypothetical protein
MLRFHFRHKLIDEVKMSKLNKRVGIVLISLIALTVSTISSAGNVSFFVGFAQPAMMQETYAPVEMRPVYYAPREHKQCYIQPPVYVNGILYPAQRICEHRFAPMQTGWAPENSAHYHRHHVT